MALEDIPVWTFPANWSSDLVETLEWKTDVLGSPTGAEQRRSLRMYPRRFFEFTLLLNDNVRSSFDQYLITHGSADCYLPLWHDGHFAPGSFAIDATSLAIPDADAGWFLPGGGAFVDSGDAPTSVLVEIESISSPSLELAEPLPAAFAPGAGVYPTRKARLIGQPQATRVTDTLWQASAKFLVTQPSAPGDVVVGTTVPTIPSLGGPYLGFSVLTLEPNASEPSKYDYDRMIEVLDNSTGLPTQVDTAQRTFPRQDYQWLLDGRAQHKAFERMLYGARGRAIPFWVPTYQQDMVLAADAAPGATSITVEQCGFTLYGGPRWDRQNIRILLADGTAVFRRITGCAIAGDNELITFSGGLPAGVTRANVVQISFMALMRFDQDAFEIHHKTDVDGVSTCAATLRAAPELRVATSAF